MSDTFYTKEELELLGASAEEEPMPQTAPMGQQYPQGMSYQQQENAPHFIQAMQDPSSKTYRNVHMGMAVANSVKLIVFGLIFALIPLFMLTTVVYAMKADGVGGIVTAIPVLMISLFVLVGVGVFVKGIRELIRAIKNK